MGYSYYPRSMYGVKVNVFGNNEELFAFFAQHGYPVDREEFKDSGYEALTENTGERIEVVGVEHGYGDCVVGIECKTAEEAREEFEKRFPNVKNATMHEFTQIL